MKNIDLKKMNKETIKKELDELLPSLFEMDFEDYGEGLIQNIEGYFNVDITDLGFTKNEIYEKDDYKRFDECWLDQDNLDPTYVHRITNFLLKKVDKKLFKEFLKDWKEFRKGCEGLSLLSDHVRSLKHCWGSVYEVEDYYRGKKFFECFKGGQ